MEVVGEIIAIVVGFGLLALVCKVIGEHIGKKRDEKLEQNQPIEVPIEIDKETANRLLKGLPEAFKQAEKTFEDFKGKCREILEKTHFILENSQCSFISNKKAVCDYILWYYFNTRISLCQITYNRNFINHLDNAFEEVLPLFISKIIDLQDIKDFISTRINEYDDIMQKSQDKDRDLIYAINQFISKDLSNIESNEIFIESVTNTLDRQIEIVSLYKLVTECTKQEFEQIKNFSSIYVKTGIRL